MVHTVLPSQAADIYRMEIPEGTVAAEMVAPGLCKYHSGTADAAGFAAGTVDLEYMPWTGSSVRRCSALSSGAAARSGAVEVILAGMLSWCCGSQ